MSDCTKCALAVWERTPTGRIKRNHYGRCTAPEPDMRALPIAKCFSIQTPRRTVIWADMPHTNCQEWKPIDAALAAQGDKP